MNRLEKKECECCHKLISKSNMARHKRLKGCNRCKDCGTTLIDNIKCTRCLECYRQHIEIYEYKFMALKKPITNT
jgi:hypothetical protein